MKIELIKEEEYNQGPWYKVKVDGEVIQLFAEEDTAAKLFEAIIADPNILKKKEIILDSREIVVSLQDEITTKKEEENGKETN